MFEKPGIERTRCRGGEICMVTKKSLDTRSKLKNRAESKRGKEGEKSDVIT